ncbi:hypothetical protein, partial [Acinetobacter lactucae]|uniref:hypothetical protein n=1 Tax=Acinetobacter lactucae TaxID=1785128 RepID=UPI00157FE2DB
MEKTKFSKREWIHLIITLSIIQAGVWFVSFVYAGSTNALGYVSFAGTLISIILAVLAIGYTYGESQQQKNSSATLANQIDSLITIKEKLEVQAESLQGIKLLEENFAKFSNQVESRFMETQHQVNIVHQGVNSIAYNTLGHKQAALDLSFLFNNAKAFDNFYHHLNFCLIAVFIDREFKKNIHNTFDEFNIILNELNFEYYAMYTSRDMIVGGCTTTCNMLSFLGVFNYQLDHIDPLLIDFFKYCRERLKEAPVTGNNL